MKFEKIEKFRFENNRKSIEFEFFRSVSKLLSSARSSFTEKRKIGKSSEALSSSISPQFSSLKHVNMTL